MIDRPARDVAAKLLEDFISGSISNYKYNQSFPTSKIDSALWPIYVNVWFCYSDVGEYTLTGKRALSPEQRALCERSILFLRSNLEFQWPPPEFRLRYGLMRLLGFGRVLKQRESKEMSIGDLEVWPFLKRSEYEELSSQRSADCA